MLQVLWDTWSEGVYITFYIALLDIYGRIRQDLGYGHTMVEQGDESSEGTHSSRRNHIRRTYARAGIRDT